MNSNLENKIWRIQRDWEGQAAVIIAGGPSLTQEQVDYVYDSNVKVIAINNAYLLAPWADILYACDANWWKWHNGVPEFAGMKVGLRYFAGNGECEGKWTDDLYPDVKSIIYEKPLDDHRNEIGGISTVPGLVRSGKDSGYQAIQIAIQLGAKKIVLLGFDMKSEAIDLSRKEIYAILEQALAPDYPLLKKEAVAHAMMDIRTPHWHGHHPDNVPPPFDLMLKQYKTMAPAVDALGVQIINCSIDTALHEFWEADLKEAI